jgi:hypothetical protein
MQTKDKTGPKMKNNTILSFNNQPIINNRKYVKQTNHLTSKTINHAHTKQEVGIYIKKETTTIF